MANCSVIILAAGKGTRMKSTLPKVLHPIAGKPMLVHVIDAAFGLDPESITVVLAPGMDTVQQVAMSAYPNCKFAIQKEQKGTGHAVACGMEELDAKGDVLVVYGDTPLMLTETLSQIMQQKEQQGATISLAGIHLEDPTGYGRLVMPEEPFVERIVEQKDASEEQKRIQWGWGGIMAFSADFLKDGLAKMTPSEATGEYYLTELLEMSSAAGNKNLMVPMDVEEAMGVNDKVQLAEAEAVKQTRLREEAMRAGVTMTAPETVFLSEDTTFGKDVVIHPHVVFGPSVTIGDGVEIKSFCHIEHTKIDRYCIVGPYARLRPGTELAEDVRIGNFVELKKAKLARGAKVNHLSYIGDSELGEEVNIGAGTITCNYDGKLKHKTIVKDGAFIGSNTALVAPIEVGENTVIGAGSVITQDVPDDSLALGRSAQVVKMKKESK